MSTPAGDARGRVGNAATDTRALRAEIEAEGRARVEAIERETEERIASMRALHEAETARRRADALRGPDRALRGALARDLAQARAAGERRVLEARQALLERVFAAAREALAEASATPAARDRLVERAREALRFVPEGEAVISCSPAVAELLQARLADDDTHAEARDATDGATDDDTREAEPAPRIEARDDHPPGFQVTAVGGALVIDGTLERLLELGRPRLSIEVLRLLGGETA